MAMAKILFLCIAILLFIPWSMGSSTNGKINDCDDLTNIDDRLFLIETNIRTILRKVSNTFEADGPQLSILDKKLNILTNVEAKMNALDTKLEKVLTKINKIENDVEHLKFSFEISDVKNLNQMNQITTDEFKFKINDLDAKLSLVPLKLDVISLNINVLEKSVERINNNLDARNENDVLENVLNKIKNVENSTEYLKNSCDKTISNIEKCNESKQSNKTVIAKDPLVLSNQSFDYTFCNNKSGMFKFRTNEIKSIEETRFDGVRLCDNGWLVIQNRNSFDYQENFNRSWNDYKHGFGDLRKEFWFGNDFLHRLSHQTDLILRIELESFDNGSKWVEYESFKVNSEYENYRLKLGHFTGTVADSMITHNNMKFTTFDKDNDLYSDDNCAILLEGGWWFSDCNDVQLNGIYHKVPTNDRKGIFWYTWLKRQTLKSVKMMVKPKNYVIQFNDLTFETYNPL